MPLGECGAYEQGSTRGQGHKAPSCPTRLPVTIWAQGKSCLATCCSASLGSFCTSAPQSNGVNCTSPSHRRPVESWPHPCCLCPLLGHRCPCSGIHSDAQSPPAFATHGLTYWHQQVKRAEAELTPGCWRMRADRGPGSSAMEPAQLRVGPWGRRRGTSFPTSDCLCALLGANCTSKANCYSPCSSLLL